MNPPRFLFIVTGSQGAGKTSFCADIISEAQKAGWRTAGLLSRAVFDGSQRTAINAEDIATGQTRRLAIRSEGHPAAIGCWIFDEDTLSWGNTVLKNSLPCDLLVIDELGPLEFDQGLGWQEGFAALDAEQYAIAMVVVRPKLLGQALLRWSKAYIIEIETPEESVEKARILSRQLF